MAMTIALVVAACAAPPSSSVTESPGPGSARPGAGSWITAGARPGIGGCPLFPPNHAWHASIGSLAVHPRSSAMIAATASTTVRPGFGSTVWMGSRAGVPINVVDGRSAARVDVVVDLWGTDGGNLGVPLPDVTRFEGWPGKAWDAHLLVVDTSVCESRELLNVRDPSDDVLGLGGGRWYADSAGTFDLTSTAKPAGTATASGVSLLAGQVRYDEVAAGEIDHVLSATLTGISAAPAVWPAMSSDGTSVEPDAMPMGTWLRLRADADLADLGPHARIIADALREHGAVVTDTGPGLTLQGEPDERWDSHDLRTLANLSMADFEVVDAAPMMAERTSFELRRAPSQQGG
jgi:hypothetical protein